ncbi:MAG: hypothetical protein WC856_20550 [Methylococcaceae bacterium]|jgi:hypothetical protein
MKKLIIIATALMAGCTTVKDTNGKDAGTCIGLPCLMRAAVGHPLVVPASVPESATVAVNTQDEKAAKKLQE